jgi:hypothetical protein
LSVTDGTLNSVQLQVKLTGKFCLSAEAMGLDWSGQYRRTQRDPILSEGIAVMATPFGRAPTEEAPTEQVEKQTKVKSRQDGADPELREEWYPSAVIQGSTAEQGHPADPGAPKTVRWRMRW